MAKGTDLSKVSAVELRTIQRSLFAFLDGGGWLTHHQLTVDGSVDSPSRRSLLELVERAKVPDAGQIIDQVLVAVERWPDHAAAAGVLDDHTVVVTRALAQTDLAA